MPRAAFAGLQLEWDAGDLPLDPFCAALPLPLTRAAAADAEPAVPPDLLLRASLASAPATDPARAGATPVLFHGATRCFRNAGGELVLWDGASLLTIRDGGAGIDARVHASSLERAFHFSSVTVTMALLLALREHGLFHLHAAAAAFDDGDSWLIPGESNAGKSTLALALFDAGARYVSDDAVLLRAAGTAVEAVGLTRMLRVTAQTAAAFPALRPLLAACPPGSARELELDPRVAFARRCEPSLLAPRVLVFTRIAEGSESQVTRLDRAEAFGRILHSCAWVASEHVPHRGEQLGLLGRLVDGARAYDVAVSRAILTDPAAVVADLRTRLAEG